jgi:hypothetical protein
MDKHTIVVENEPDAERLAAPVDGRDAKLVLLTAAWERALVELFGERAAA